MLVTKAKGTEMKSRQREDILVNREKCSRKNYNPPKNNKILSKNGENIQGRYGQHKQRLIRKIKKY